MSSRGDGLNGSGRPLHRWVTGGGVLLLLLHAYGAWRPGASDWGFHQWAFLPPPAGIALGCLMLALLLPQVQRAILTALAPASAAFTSLTAGLRRFILVLFGASAAALFWRLREPLLLYGDGAYLVRSVAAIPGVEGIPAAFKHEPLAGALTWRAFGLLHALDPSVSVQDAFQILAAALGFISLVLIVLLLRRSGGAAGERALLALFVVSCGGSALFFGHVENYVFAYAGLLGFAFCALSFLEGRLPLILPSLLFGALIPLDFAAVALLPVFLALVVREFRRGRPGSAATGLAAMILTAAALLVACGYDIPAFVQALRGSGSFMVPFGEASDRAYAYRFFSLPHLADQFNVQMFFSPFAACVLAWLAFRRSAVLRERLGERFPFLLLLAACSAVFLAVVNPEIGASRDWDIFSPFALAICMAAALALGAGVAESRTLLLLAGLTLLHTASSVAVQSSMEASLARFEVLEDPRYWSPNALALSYEERAVFHRERNELGKSLDLYFRYLDRCPPGHEARIWGNIAGLFRQMGDMQRELEASEKAVAAGSRKPELLFRLGALCADAGRREEAIAYTRTGLGAANTSAEGWYLLGSYLQEWGGDCREAIGYLKRSIALDASYAPAYAAAGRCYRALGETAGMKASFERFLALSPAGPESDSVRAMMREIR